jgi:beta-apo-4'-carotenal oxygenase
MMSIRYPPYTLKKQEQYLGMSTVKPNFDRQGRTIGWFGWAFGLVGIKSIAALIGK